MGYLDGPEHEHDCVDPRQVVGRPGERKEKEIGRCVAPRQLTVLRLDREESDRCRKQNCLAEGEHEEDHPTRDIRRHSSGNKLTTIDVEI